MGRKKPSCNVHNKKNNECATSSPPSTTITAPVDSDQNPNPIPCDHSNVSAVACPEDLLRMYLVCIYCQALAYLRSKGYDKSLALRAILSNGYCVGDKDAFSNIITNTISALRSGHFHGSAFRDLRQMADFSISCMVASLLVIRPNLTRGEALGYLLWSKIHLLNACMLANLSWKYPLSRVKPIKSVVESVLKSLESMSLDDVDDTKIEIVYERIEMINELRNQVEERKEWARERALQAVKKLCRDTIELKILRIGKQEGLPMKCTLEDELSERKNVKTCEDERSELDNALDVLKVKNEQMTIAITSVANDLKVENKDMRAEIETEKMELLESAEELKEVERKEKKMMKKKLVCEDERSELDNALDDFKVKKEQMTIAINMANDLEMGNKELRAEREAAKMELLESAKELKGVERKEKKLSCEDERSELDNVLDDLKVKNEQKAIAISMANDLEMENKELRAEIEAAKMELLESVKELKEVERKEKKTMKKKLAWDKQRQKLVEEIDEESRKIEAIEKELDDVKTAQVDVDAKWREEKKAVEEAITLVEEACRAKEETEITVNARQEALGAKSQTDNQIYKDDIKRLEDELSLLLSQSKISEMQKPRKKGINRNEPEILKMSNRRKCTICMDKEVNIVFLPCRHQVICISCSDDHKNKENASCPSCNVPVRQRIHVFCPS